MKTHLFEVKEVGAHEVFEKIPQPLSWLERSKRV